MLSALGLTTATEPEAEADASQVYWDTTRQQWFEPSAEPHAAVRSVSLSSERRRRSASLPRQGAAGAATGERALAAELELSALFCRLRRLAEASAVVMAPRPALPLTEVSSVDKRDVVGGLSIVGAAQSTAAAGHDGMFAAAVAKTKARSGGLGKLSFSQQNRLLQPSSRVPEGGSGNCSISSTESPVSAHCGSSGERAKRRMLRHVTKERVRGSLWREPPLRARSSRSGFT